MTFIVPPNELALIMTGKTLRKTQVAKQPPICPLILYILLNWQFQKAKAPITFASLIKSANLNILIAGRHYTIRIFFSWPYTVRIFISCP